MENRETEKAKRKPKNPDEIKQEFAKWKLKQEARVLSLYRKRQSELEKVPDVNDTDESIAARKKAVKDMAESIANIEKAINQRQARDERKLLRIYDELDPGNSREAKDARRQRTHRLCQLGGLVEKAGLGNMDHTTLLGMLLQQKEYLEKNQNMLSRWKEKGQEAQNQSLEGFNPHPAPPAE